MRGEAIRATGTARQRRRRRLAAFAGALAALLAATAAQAQTGNPTGSLGVVPSDAGQSCHNQTQLDNCDTDYTPIAKESPLWQTIQGARYDAKGPETEDEYLARQASVANSAEEQVTSWEDELTDVHFQNTRNGFAAGQRKLDCDSDGEPETYVPVIYRYGDSPTGLRWLPPDEEHDGLLGDCDSPGFVGQITWIRTTGMALAVGGTGSYPHREPAYGKDIEGNDCAPDPDKPYGANCDQAGTGRAWLYNNREWQELDEDPDTFPLPSGPDEWDGLRGMTALDFSPLPGKDFGFVGGLGQIWPVLVNVQGQNGPCPFENPNACVSFPADGKIPDVAGAVGKFDMWSRRAPEPVDAVTEGAASDPPPAGSTIPKDWTQWEARRADEAASGDTDNASRFRFRVRQVRTAISSDGAVAAVAVTDGCCAEREPYNYPSLITFENVQGKAAGAAAVGGQGPRWQLWSADPYAQGYEHAGYYGLSEEQRRQLPPPNTRLDLPDSFYSVTFQSSGFNVEKAPKVALVASPGGPAAAAERPSIVTEPICTFDSLINSHPLTGPQGALDRAQPGQLFTALRAQLSSVRLVDGDGDDLVAFNNWAAVAPAVFPATSPPAHGAPSNAQRQAGGAVCEQGNESRQSSASSAGGADRTKDAVPDWTVGELRSTEAEGLGARGLAFSTVSRPTLIPDTLDVGLYEDGLAKRDASGNANTTFDPSHIQSDPTNYRPTTPEKLAAYLQSQYFYTGSYALNALDYIDGTGTGWAVGAHGGIAQLGGSGQGLAGAARSEPEPPRLSGRTPTTAPDRSPYEDLDHPAHEPGAVPSLATRPNEDLDEAELRFAGAPDAARDYAGRSNELGQIVMSRDGSEGWGLDRAGAAAGSEAMALYHYEGGEWSRCDPEGIDGVLEADRACSALTPLRDYSVRGEAKGVSIAAAARIPYEHDENPRNDDQFEVLAIGTGYRTPEEAKSDGGTNLVPPSLLRYHDGAWRLEQDARARLFLQNHLTYSSGEKQGSFQAEIETAFVSPDDGWVLEAPADPPIGGTSNSVSRLLHFDGERWIDCTTHTGADPGVSDSEGRLAAGEEGKELRKDWCDDPGGLTISIDDLSANENGRDVDQLTGLTSVGDRLYLHGWRAEGSEAYPLVLCKDAGGPWMSEGCGLDPGLAVRRGEASGGMTGGVTALSVAPGADGSPRGWAGGAFSGAGEGEPASWLLRLDGDRWVPFADEGPLSDRLAGFGPRGAPMRIVAQPDGGGLLTAGDGPGFGLFGFSAETERWRPVAADLLPGPISDIYGGNGGRAVAMSSDNLGGAWLGLRSGSADDLLHYSPTPPEPVFAEAPSPLPTKRETFTALAGEPDGSLWAATAGAALYRYERTTGWDRTTIPGWQHPRATVSPQAYAIAVNESGVGVVAGREGRIADIDNHTIRLDAAAGTLCDLASVAPPCGTSRHLRAAAVAPDGSAMVGGEQLSLLWRPAGGDFRAIEKPEASPSSTVTGLSMPDSTTAFLTTSTGLLFRGQGSGESWSWRLENTDAGSSLLTRDPTSVRPPLSLSGVAVDSSGHGYAAGEDGVLLERIGDGAQPWRRIRSGVSDDLTEVVLSNENALVGGEEGLVLTGEHGDFQIARPPDQDGGSTGDVVGLAVAGGVAAGQAEAWAMTDGPGARAGFGVRSVSQVFHYTSDPSERLLDPGSALEPLSDAPAPREGEISFAALGKVDCHLEGSCPGLGAVGADYAAISRQAAEAIAARAQQPNGPELALFTGDIVDEGGLAGGATLDTDAPLSTVPAATAASVRHRAGMAKLRAARSWIAEPLTESGLGFFASLGGQDLSEPCPQTGSCFPTQAQAGTSDAWRKVFASESAPWGSGEQGFPSTSYEMEPVEGEGTRIALEDQSVDTGAAAGEKELFLSGARTHYAFDLTEPGADRPAARFVFADNATRSLAASDPLQNPIEAEGQAAWLESVLCFRGGEPECTREAGQPAIVVANAPTYSYASTDPTANATDATQFEALLIRHGVSAVISGSLGWNGRYWATAAGVHAPCIGDPYREAPPAPGTRECENTPSAHLPIAANGAPAPPEELAEPYSQAQAAATDLTGTGLLPFVVASGAGGKLAGTEASDGFWHGYTIVRVPADGNPAGLVVEQRPILEHLSVTARSHTASPRQRLALRGVGRGPITYDSSHAGLSAPHTADFLPIDTQAITHRYDLVLADPDEPWMPCKAGDVACDELHAGLSKAPGAEGPVGESAGDAGAELASQTTAAEGNPCAPYLCLPERIGRIDRTTGEIRAGDGRYPETFAIAMLSVGEKVATYPLAFERTPSFVVKSVATTPTPPKSSNPPTPRPPGQPLLPEPPTIPKIDIPQIPEPPAIPLTDAAAPPEPQPPAPPAPPPPAEQPAALDLTVAPPGISISTPTALIQPPTPPVNPAPPGGARREARQRQAAAQKGGADSSESEQEGLQGDLAGDRAGPEASPMTRHSSDATRRDRTRAEPSFTTLSAADQPSAWSRGALYGGGLTLAAALAAIGFSVLRPTPKRRSPSVPAPAHARAHRRRY